MEEEEVAWSRETIPKVLKIVSTRLPQRELISLLLVSPWLNATLVGCPSIWLHLDFREMNNAGNRLVDALSLTRYRHVKHINLEFAQDIEDKHLELVKSKITCYYNSHVPLKTWNLDELAKCSHYNTCVEEQGLLDEVYNIVHRQMLFDTSDCVKENYAFLQCRDSLQDLEVLNLNGCQKISDKGIEAITSACPSLKEFSIYWNVRVTDIGIAHLGKNCKHIVDLNVSGCKNLSDKSLQLIAQNYPELQLLNLTRCVKLTDSGLQQILHGCPSLHSLNLYALSSFTDEAYKKISLLSHLKFLDLCGAQNLSDEGVACIARCKGLLSLNLTWCVRATDVGVIAVAQGCTSLEFLSLFGIVGVTDKCLEALSLTCSNTLTTLDVNGCTGIERRSRDDLLQMFPKLRCFKVHS